MSCEIKLAHVCDVRAESFLKRACNVSACGVFFGHAMWDCTLAHFCKLFVANMAINGPIFLFHCNFSDFSGRSMFIHPFLMLSKTLRWYTFSAMSIRANSYSDYYNTK